MSSRKRREEISVGRKRRVRRFNMRPAASARLEENVSSGNAPSAHPASACPFDTPGSTLDSGVLINASENMNAQSRTESTPIMSDDGVNCVLRLPDELGDSQRVLQPGDLLIGPCTDELHIQDSQENGSDTADTSSSRERDEEETRLDLEPGRSRLESEADGQQLAARADSILRWNTLAAVLMATGTKRLTVSQYSMFASWLNWALDASQSKQGVSFPSYSKLMRSVIPELRRACFARSDVYRFKLNMERSGARVPPIASPRADSSSSLLEDPSYRAPVSIVVPSEWALLDTQTGSLYDIMYRSRISEAAEEEEPCFGSVEDAPVRSERMMRSEMRALVYAPPPEEGASHSYAMPRLLRPGDSIVVQCREELRLLEHLLMYGIDNELYYLSSGAVQATVIDVHSMRNGATRGLRPGSDLSLRLLDVLRGESSLFTGGELFMVLSPRPRSTFTEPRCYLLLTFGCSRREETGHAALYCLPVPSAELSHGTARYVPFSVRVRGFRLETALNETNPHFTRAADPAPSRGTLQDGRKYLVYRALLYCDDFQPYVGRKGSVGGCYMLPLCIPAGIRHSVHAVRVLGLTPPGVSTNEVLRAIIPDIVRGATQGFDGQDPDGDAVTVFLDIIGFIGDYPAVSHTLDVLGHNARSPCHLCSFTRDEVGGGRSRYGYRSDVHSRSASYARCKERVACLRGSGASAGELRISGIKPMDADKVDLPLHELSDALENARSSVPLTERGIPVVPAFFDPYQSCMVAPDHLFAGLTVDVVGAAISVSSTAQRRVAEASLLEVLRDLQMTSQSRLFDHARGSLLSMAFSELFGVLLVAPNGFGRAWLLEKSSQAVTTQEAPPNSGRKAVQVGTEVQTGSESCTAVVLALLHKMQDLFAETNYYPSHVLEGSAAVKSFNRSAGETRLDYLRTLACEYVSAIDTAVQRFPDVLRKHLDKPNVHRLVELYTHTIPALGHVRHIHELVLESAHQHLKRGCTRSNHKDPQLAAMSSSLARDWSSRLSIEMRSAGFSSEVSGDDVGKFISELTESSHLRLLRVLLGGNVRPEHVRNPRFGLEKLLVPPLFSVLSGLTSEPLMFKDIMHIWMPRGKLTDAPGFTSARDAVLLFLRLSTDVHPDSDGAFVLWNSADRFVIPRRQKSPRSRRLGTLRIGSVLEVLSKESAVKADGAMYVLVEQQPGDASTLTEEHLLSMSRYLVAFIFSCTVRCGSHSRDEQCFVAAHRLLCADENAGIFTVTSQDTIRILRLTENVRECLKMHACQAGGCEYDQDLKTLSHTRVPGSQSAFYVYGRRQGYPPHAG